jgi:hypothetical protein
MSRGELVFHVFQPELRELPTRVNFNASDLVQPPGATHPCRPALPASKIGDTISVRMPVRFDTRTRMDVLLGRSPLHPPTSVRVIDDEESGSLEAEMDEYAKWLKEREASLRSRGLPVH